MDFHSQKWLTQKAWVVPILVLLVLGIAALLPGEPGAQMTGSKSTQTEPSPTPEEPKGPQPIPASQISIKSDETNELLRSMRERPEPDPDIEAIREMLPKSLGELQDLLGETEGRLKGTVSSRTLEDLERRWSRYKQRVDDWQTTVNRRAQALDRDLETLQELRMSWETTRNGAKDAGLQDALLALFLGFGDFTLDFQLRAWTAETSFLKIKSELTMAVNKAINDAGIVIPFPQRDVRLTTADSSPPDSISEKEPSDES